MRGMRSAAKQPEPAKRPEATSLKQTLAMLWPYLWQFKYRVLLALLALVAAKAATLLMPLALKHIVDALDQGQHNLLVVPLAMLLLYGGLRFASVFFGEVRDALFGRVTEHAMRKLGLRVFQHLHSLELAFHLDRQTGGISRDIERGTNGLSFLMRFLMFNIAPTLFEILAVAVIFATLFSPLYSLVTVLAVGIYIFFTVVITEWRNKYTREANQADNTTNKAKTTQLGVSVPVGATGKVLASWAQTTLSATDISRKTFTVGYDHFLSKRTDLYVMAMADRITSQAKGSSMGVGVRHRF